MNRQIKVRVYSILSTNGLAFLFSEMKFELNGVERQKLKLPGISSTLKGFCSFTPSDLNELENSAWDLKHENANSDFIRNNKFSGCIQLKHLFGFCEDYRKILLNCNQNLILNRSSTDFDAILCTGVTESVAKKLTIVLKKVIWKMPVIRVSDREKLKLIKVLDSRKPLTCAYRTWDLYEYPVLPLNKSHSWTVKSSNLLEKPRFVIIGLQTSRKNDLFRSSAIFDSCKIKNLKVYLNSEMFPYESFRVDFPNNLTSIVYKAYTDFQKSYYARGQTQPLLSKKNFSHHGPIIVVDLSRQNDNVKASTVDLRLEFETEDSIPEHTAAYCLILHDQIISYNPFNVDVRKM